jgi:hypothetical protein
MTRVSPEEYISATIELYLDIINLFIEILKILERVNRKDVFKSVIFHNHRLLSYLCSLNYVTIGIEFII